jgi:putative ABC transport system substrate-binding protein
MSLRISLQMLARAMASPRRSRLAIPMAQISRRLVGQNVAIEYRSANNQPNRLPALVTDLIDQRVAVIVGNTESSLAAKAATTTIPIVFATGSDPVKDGLVVSLNRPGGNVTGVSFFSAVLGAK